MIELFIMGSTTSHPTTYSLPPPMGKQPPPPAPSTRTLPPPYVTLAATPPPTDALPPAPLQAPPARSFAWCSCCGQGWTVSSLSPQSPDFFRHGQKRPAYNTSLTAALSAWQRLTRDKGTTWRATRDKENTRRSTGDKLTPWLTTRHKETTWSSRWGLRWLTATAVSSVAWPNRSAPSGTLAHLPGSSLAVHSSR